MTIAAEQVDAKEHKVPNLQDQPAPGTAWQRRHTVAVAQSAHGGFRLGEAVRQGVSLLIVSPDDVSVVSPQDAKYCQGCAYSKVRLV